MTSFTRQAPLPKPEPGAPPAPRGSGPAVEWERAYRDALRSLRQLPEPWEIAVSLPRHLREALLSASRGRNGWRVAAAAVDWEALVPQGGNNGS